MLEHGSARNGPGAAVLALALLASPGIAAGESPRLVATISGAGRTGVTLAAFGTTVVTEGSSETARLYEPDAQGNWTLVTQLDEGLPVDAQYGRTVALGRDVVAVGAPADGPGSVWLYGRDQGGRGQWGLVRKLVPASSAPGTQFGASLALAGDVLMVGAPGDGSATSLVDGPGCVTLYRRDLGGPQGWGLLQQLSPPGGSAARGFGSAVALTRDHAAVYGLRTGQALLEGSVTVYDRVGGSWVEAAELRPPAGGDRLFGWSLDLSGEVLAVGRPSDPDDPQATGVVRIYDRTPGTGGGWVQSAELSPDDVAVGDGFGWSVSLRGRTLWAGGPQATRGGSPEPWGALWSFERGLLGNWTQKRRLDSTAVSTSNVLFGSRVVQTAGWLFVTGTQRMQVFALPDLQRNVAPTRK